VGFKPEVKSEALVEVLMENVNVMMR